MPVTARLKLRGDIPWPLEHKLVTTGGFKVFSRKPREWVIMEKRRSNFKPEVLVDGELPEDVQATLLNRCNNICHMFTEPELHIGVIRRRIENICLTLPPLQRQFVQRWMDTNVVEEQ